MPKKVTILGVPVDAITMGEAVARIDGFIEKRTPVLVATANAEMLMRATHDGALRRILQGAAMVTPDGAGTVWAAHHLGYAMPERVAGYDMVQELMREAPAKRRRIFFFGSAPGVADKAKKKAEQLYPGIEIVGTLAAVIFLFALTSLPSSRRSRRRIPTSCSRPSACPSRRNG